MSENADDKKIEPAKPEAQPQELSDEAKRMQSQWEAYFAGLSDDYVKRVTELAKNQAYAISLGKKTGRKVKHPITDEEIDEIEGWEQKNYDRKKISSKDWHLVEKMRASNNKEKDQEKFQENLAKIYEFLAYCYLGMTHDEYIRTDWEEIKPIIDACNFRTVYSIPNSAKPST